MPTQLLAAVTTVTLDSGDSIDWAHGLRSGDQPVQPTQVIAGGPTTIGVTAVTGTVVTLENLGPDTVTATFRAEFDHSIHAIDTPTVAWSGWDGTARPAGPAGGDLDETYPDPRVVGFAGKPIDTSAPAANDYWRFDGTEWKHTLVAPGDADYIGGSFTSTADQPIPQLPNTLAVTYNVTELSNGVTVVGGSCLTVAEDGVYAFDISPQLYHTGGSGTIITFWAKLNGVNMPRSASSLEMGNNNNRTLPFLQLDIPMTAGQCLEWFFTQTGVNTSLEHFAASGPIPEIPSVIVNVKRLGAIP